LPAARLPIDLVKHDLACRFDVVAAQEIIENASARKTLRRV